MSRLERLGQLEAEFPLTEHLELSVTATVLDLLDRPEEIQRLRDDWDTRVRALEEAGKRRIAARETELTQARIAHLTLVNDVCTGQTLERAQKRWDENPERMLRKFQRDRPFLERERRRRSR